MPIDKSKKRRAMIFGVLIFALIFVAATILGELVSSEVDELCIGVDLTALTEEDILVLSRFNGTWVCTTFNNVVFNVTVNNITNIFNNASIPFEAQSFSRDANLSPHGIEATGINDSGKTITSELRIRQPSQSVMYFVGATNNNIASIFSDQASNYLAIAEYISGNFELMRFNFNGDTLFYRPVRFNGSVIINGTLSVFGDANFSNTVWMNESLKVNGTFNVGDNYSVSYNSTTVNNRFGGLDACYGNTC